MVKSIHFQALHSVVDKLMGDPDKIYVYSDYLRKMRSGHFDKTYIDNVMQKYSSYGDDEYDIYDAYAFAQFHFLMGSGKLASAKVNIGLKPKANDEVEYHNNVLRKGKIIYGAFVGGLGDSDGHITWDKPLEFQIMHASETDDTIERSALIVSSRQLPLEVGFTDGSRTLLHLYQDHGLARWPYGSKIITLYLNLDQSRVDPLLLMDGWPQLA